MSERKLKGWFEAVAGHIQRLAVCKSGLERPKCQAVLLQAPDSKWERVGLDCSWVGTWASWSHIVDELVPHGWTKKVARRYEEEHSVECCPCPRSQHLPTSPHTRGGRSWNPTAPPCYIHWKNSFVVAISFQNHHLMSTTYDLDDLNNC